MRDQSAPILGRSYARSEQTEDEFKASVFARLNQSKQNGLYTIEGRDIIAFKSPTDKRVQVWTPSEFATALITGDSKVSDPVELRKYFLQYVDKSEKDRDEMDGLVDVLALQDAMKKPHLAEVGSGLELLVGTDVVAEKISLATLYRRAKDSEPEEGELDYRPLLLEFGKSNAQREKRYQQLENLHGPLLDAKNVDWTQKAGNYGRLALEQTKKHPGIAALVGLGLTALIGVRGCAAYMAPPTQEIPSHIVEKSDEERQETKINGFYSAYQTIQTTGGDEELKEGLEYTITTFEAKNPTLTLEQQQKLNEVKHFLEKKQ